MENQNKKAYQKPAVEDWGTVTDLTAGGQTNSGADTKAGSNANTQGQ